MKAADIMLKSLPPPTEPHCNVVTKLIARVFEKYHLSETEIKKRYQVMEDIYEVVSPSMPGMSVQSHT